jgi:hypothetical protein
MSVIMPPDLKMHDGRQACLHGIDEIYSMQSGLRIIAVKKIVSNGVACPPTFQ